MNENDVTQIHPNQITSGKTILRGRIKELEAEVIKLKEEPLRHKLDKLQSELADLRTRCLIVEDQTRALVDIALQLARTVTAE